MKNKFNNYGRWPTDRAVPGSSLTRGGDLFTCKRGYTANSVSLFSTHYPDTT